MEKHALHETHNLTVKSGKNRTLILERLTPKLFFHGKDETLTSLLKKLANTFAAMTFPTVLRIRFGTGSGFWSFEINFL
jgi:hypothetical protein